MDRTRYNWFRQRTQRFSRLSVLLPAAGAPTPLQFVENGLQPRIMSQLLMVVDIFVAPRKRSSGTNSLLAATSLPRGTDQIGGGHASTQDDLRAMNGGCC